MIRTTFAALLIATPAFADLETRAAAGSVDETMDALVTAVEGAGATVFARVDHAAGARSVDMDLPDAQLLIFGNPKLGTPAMQDDIQAGLMLPLRVLVHEADGATRIVWQDPREMFEGLSIGADAGYVAAMEGALDKLTGAAAGE